MNVLIRRLAATAAAVCALSPAHAIVINNTFGAAGAQGYGAAAAFASVVRFSTGTGSCSGALISLTTVLTAQHCTFGKAAAGMSVGFDLSGDGTAVVGVGVSAKFELDATNVLLDGTDIAFLTLTSAPPAWAVPLQLYDGDPVGMTAIMVGYGLQGTGTTGTNVVQPSPRARWAADNVVDFFGKAALGGPHLDPGSDNIISTDFDDEFGSSNILGALGSSPDMLTREGTTAPGDSGGPLLLQFGSSYLISGVLSGGTTPFSTYTDISWWTGVGKYRDTIERYGGVFFTPEPATAVLVALGLIGALAGRAAARKRRAASGPSPRP